jgi:hypothetical protein
VAPAAVIAQLEGAGFAVDLHAAPPGMVALVATSTERRSA